jgi:hypothetical protein
LFCWNRFPPYFWAVLNFLRPCLFTCCWHGR